MDREARVDRTAGLWTGRLEWGQWTGVRQAELWTVDCGQVAEGVRDERRPLVQTHSVREPFGTMELSWRRSCR